LGDYVVSTSWLDRVAEVSLQVDVAFDDDALCTLTRTQRKRVRDQRTEEDN
jgi:ubiquitin-conjugating enzyme E2 O